MHSKDSAVSRFLRECGNVARAADATIYYKYIIT